MSSTLSTKSQTNISNSNGSLVNSYAGSSSSTTSTTNANNNAILIISGGDGYEDFRNSGPNSLSDVAGREDSTNHLLIWQI